MNRAITVALLALFLAIDESNARAQQAPTEQLEALGYVGVPRFRVQSSEEQEARRVRAGRRAARVAEQRAAREARLAERRAAREARLAERRAAREAREALRRTRATSERASAR